MRDIVDRLRTWVHAVDAVPASDLMDEAAREIDTLRLAIRRLADQDTTLSVQGGNVIVTMDATLTDAERSAIKEASEFYIGTRTGVALSGLLERMNPR